MTIRSGVVFAGIALFSLSAQTLAYHAMRRTWEYQIVEEPNPIALQERLAFLILLVSIACGPPPIRVGLRAPDPTGCYVIVYERANFSGAGDVLNGPARWSSLERMSSTNEDNWRNRIRSFRVGNTATVTIYVDLDFKGPSRQFAPKTESPQLERVFSGRIESLDLACQSRQAP